MGCQIRDIELTVVIAARNAESTLPVQLGAVLGQQWSGEWEVVVVDNESTDRTRAVMESFAQSSPRVRIVPATGRSGPAFARNVGTLAAHGNLIAFCDADDVVSDRWLGAIGDTLRSHPYVTGPLDLDQLNPPWLADSRGRSFANGPYLFCGIVPTSMTCNLGIRRDVLEAAGMFDEELTVGEDIDLACRLWQQGVPLVWNEEAKVSYRFRTDLWGLFRQSRTYSAATPKIYVKHAKIGLRVPSRWSGWKQWFWIIRHMPSIMSRPGRARWVWVAGACWGRLLCTVPGYRHTL